MSTTYEPLTEDQLSQLERRASWTADRPWFRSMDSLGAIKDANGGVVVQGDWIDLEEMLLVVEAVNAIPALLAEVRASRALAQPERQEPPTGVPGSQPNAHLLALLKTWSDCHNNGATKNLLTAIVDVLAPVGAVAAAESAAPGAEAELVALRARLDTARIVVLAATRLAGEITAGPDFTLPFPIGNRLATLMRLLDDAELRAALELPVPEVPA